MRPLLLTAFCLVTAACATPISVTEPPQSAAPEITLTKSLHFVSGDGSDLVVSPGTYAVQPGNGPRLELMSTFGIVADNRTLEAVSTNVGQPVATPVALYIPWQDDEHHIIFVQPSGAGLEAVGTGSGVRSRGLVPHPLPPDVVKKALSDYNARPIPQK